MEKISHIVRGNARVSSADVKSSSAVRPGALSFGRDVGVSSAPNDPPGTTASRAAQLQSQMSEQRRSAAEKEKVVESMADGFFMSRMRRPDENGEIRGPRNAVALARAEKAKAAAEAESVGDDGGASEELNLSGTEPEEKVQPSGYQPRGSYVDVRA